MSFKKRISARLSHYIFLVLLGSFLLLYVPCLGQYQNSLKQKWIHISKTIPAKMGISALVIETGDRLSLNENQKYPMQSLYKLPITFSALNKIDQGFLHLDQKVRFTPGTFKEETYQATRERFPMGKVLTLKQVMEYCIQNSDNWACDELIRLQGGTQAINNWVHQIPIQDIKIIFNEKKQQSEESLQYKNWAKPKALVELLRVLYSGKIIKPDSRKFLLDIMSRSVTGLKRIKGNLPPGTWVAHKTGTSGTRNGITFATNDAGIIKLPNGNHLILCILVRDAKAPMEKIESAMAQISKLAWDYWGR